MPAGFVEGLITLLGLLFLFIIPLILRLRGTAQRRRQGFSPGVGASRPQSAHRTESKEEEPSLLWPGAAWPPVREPQEAAAAPAPPPVPALPVQPTPPAPTPPQPALGMQPLAQQTPSLEQQDLHSTKRLPGRLQRLSPWQRAVVWAEILGPPRGWDGEPPLP